VVEEVVEQETLQEIQVDQVEAVVFMTLMALIQDHQELADKVMQVEQVMQFTHQEPVDQDLAVVAEQVQQVVTHHHLNQIHKQA
jgi:hypothetical protein